MKDPILSLLTGRGVHLSNLAVTQWRFPRSKKKRIRKKWAQRPENSRPGCFEINGGMLIVHPKFAEQLLAQQ